MIPKNIYYIVRNDISKENDIGFFKKFYSQISVFQKTANVYFVYFKYNNIMVEKFKSGLNGSSDVQVLASYRTKFTAHLLFYLSVFSFIKSNKIDVLYHRYKITELFFLSFLLRIKRLNKSSLIFLEFPTYPYDQNWKRESLIKKILLPLDMFFRRFLRYYIDYAVTYYDADSIYGMNTIRISNGVDVDSVTLKKNIEVTDKFVFIAVAGLGFWHGYDRVIKGIYAYYRKNPLIKAYFYIVGDGKEKNNLESLTKELNLGDYVIFHGPLTGISLDELFDKSHMGVNTIGWHRVGVVGNDTLKAREYCARGIPFVTSGLDSDFSDDFKYMFTVPEDDSPVDIARVIDYYSSINYNDFLKFMRNLAFEKMSWDLQFREVVNIINDKI